MRFLASLKRLLYKSGYHITRVVNYENEINHYKEIASRRLNQPSLYNKTDAIVFSKDRAMQLHAFLVSYNKFVKSDGKLFVLFTFSSGEHEKSYEELQRLINNDHIIFIKENNFSTQLKEVISASNAQKIVFYVDDIIFKEYVDYEELKEYDPLNHIITLGRGQDLTYSVVLNRSQMVPEFSHMRGDWYTFNWDLSARQSDWSFPLGVGAYFYDRNELLVILSELNYKSPNSLEIAMQYYRDYFIRRPGICKKNVVCVPIQANVVQNDQHSLVVNEWTVEKLLLKWNQGMMIDISAFEGKSADKAQIMTYTFVER